MAGQNVDSLEVRIEASAASANAAIKALQNSLKSLRGTLNGIISDVGKDAFKGLIQNANKVESTMKKVAKATDTSKWKFSSPNLAGFNASALNMYVRAAEKKYDSLQQKMQKATALGKVTPSLQYDFKQAEQNLRASKAEQANRIVEAQKALEIADAEERKERARKRAEEAAKREAEAEAGVSRTIAQAVGHARALAQAREKANTSGITLPNDTPYTRQDKIDNARAQANAARTLEFLDKNPEVRRQVLNASVTEGPLIVERAMKAAESATKATTAATNGYTSSAAKQYAAFRKLSQESDALTKKQKSLQNAISVKKATGEDYTKEASALEKVSARLDEVINKKSRYQGMRNLRAVDIEAIKQAEAERREAEAAQLAAERQERLRSAIEATKAAFQRIWHAIATTVSHTWRLVSALNGAHKSSEKSGMSFKKLAKFLIRYGFGMRSFFFLFRRLRRGMKEGFEHLGTYSTEAQQAIYGLKASVETLKNAFAAGFSNLLGPVTNFLQGVINAIASALNAIGRFIAALGGKGFAIQAIKVSADEMKALDKNTGGAASSAKKLDKALSVLPFDELNQLNGDKNSSGSGGGGGGSSANSLSASQMFETVALDGEEYIQQLGQRIRDAFLSKDWQTLGEVLADPINKGVDALQDKLDWTKNKPKIEAFTTGVTTTFNSLVKNVNWSKIGLTISSAINDITGAITGLVDGTDWETLGSSIGTAFNTLLENTDWEKLGETVFARIKVVLETAAGFIEKADWSKVGEAIGNFIIGALNNINLPRLGEVLGELINGGFRALKGIIDAGALGRFVSDFTTGIANLFTTIEWDEVGKIIGDGLASINWGEALVNLGTAFWDAFTGLLKGLAESDGGLIAILLGGGFIGGSVLKKFLFGSGGAAAAGAGGGFAGKLYKGISALGGGGAPGFLLSMLGIMGGTMAFGGISHLVSNRGENGQKLFYVSPSKDWGMTPEEIRQTGMTEEQLGEWLESQGVKASWNKNMSDEYGGKQKKAFAYDLIEKAKAAGKSSLKAFSTSFKGALKRFTNEKDLQKQMNAMMGETAGITSTGGQSAVNEYIAGITSKKSIISSSIAPVVSAITSAFDISGKTKAKGASATSSWFTGANDKYKQETATKIADLATKIANKFDKDSTIKGYGKTGAQAFVDGIKGYKPPENAFSSLFSNIKTAMLSDSAKKTLTDAGQSLAGWVVGGFKSVAFPPLSISVSSSQLGTDAERAEQLSRRNAGRATSIISNAVKIGWFGKGGLFDSSTIIGYGVGEAGKEAIIPLENRRTMGMIADSILGGYGTQGIADQIVRGVTEAMMMASRSQQINVNATLYTEDNEVLARAVNKGNRAITYRESALAYSGV